MLESKQPIHKNKNNNNDEERLKILLQKRNILLKNLLVLQINQMSILQKNDLTSFEAFYASRGRIIEIISDLDFRIEQTFKKIKTNTAQCTSKATDLLVLLHEKTQLIKEILELDKTLIILLESSKNLISEELKIVQKSLKAHKQYRTIALTT